MFDYGSEEFFTGGPDWARLLGPEVTPLKMVMQIMRMSASDEVAGASASQLQRLTPTVNAFELVKLLVELHFGPTCEKHLGEAADNHQAALFDLAARFLEDVLQPLRGGLKKALITDRKLVGEIEAKRAKMFAAPRGAYYYESCGAAMPLRSGEERVETAFVGDAMGGTDFLLGCSGGRGCIMGNYIAEKLVDRIQRGRPLTPSDFRHARKLLQSKWGAEFAKGEFRNDVFASNPLHADTWFRYVMDGRELSNTRFAGTNKLISRPVLKELSRQMVEPRVS